MIDIVRSEDNGKIAAKRDRYWSVMLVGDRGRIIPFKHFKGMALGICCLTFLLLAALIAVAILYISQGRKIDHLETQLTDVQLQNSKLRDEKDLYLTKLMLAQKQVQEKGEKPKSAAKSNKDVSKPAQEKAKSKAEAPVVTASKEKAPVKKEQPKIKWMADIRRFSVRYDPVQKTLNARFRIYNSSKPKKRLSGRSVVVFKVMDDPPVKWLPVPRVQLKNGEPLGTRGQTFRVRNYLTMKFRAYRQKAPVLYNTATVYVFSDKGRLLVSKDFAFKIETPPSVEKKQVKTPPADEKKTPVPEPKPTIETPAGKTPAGVTVPQTPARENTPPATPISPPQQDQSTPITPKPGVDGQEPAVDTPSGTADPSSSELPASSEVPGSGKPDRTIENPSPIETTPQDTLPQPKVEGERQ